MRATSFRPQAGALLLALSLGCASGEAARREEARTTDSRSQFVSVQPQLGRVPQCPMAMPGVQISAEDTAPGAAVRFSLQDASRVEELQTGVRSLLARQDEDVQANTQGIGVAVTPAHRCAVCPNLPPVMAPPPGIGPGGGTGWAGIESARIPAATLQVEDTADGARVLYTPEDPAELDVLRSEVRWLVLQTKSGECPLLRGIRR